MMESTISIRMILSVKMPADTKIVHVSGTVGKDQVVDELIKFYT